MNALVKRLGAPELLAVHEGSYASFASHILDSQLYVGYDSVGQHVAAAAGIPLVSVFTGYVSDRMLSRWRPEGLYSHVVTVNERDRETALARTLEAIAEAGAEAEAAEPATRTGQMT